MLWIFCNQMLNCHHIDKRQLFKQNKHCPSISLTEAHLGRSHDTHTSAQNKTGTYCLFFAGSDITRGWNLNTQIPAPRGMCFVHRFNVVVMLTATCCTKRARDRKRAVQALCAYQGFTLPPRGDRGLERWFVTPAHQLFTIVTRAIIDNNNHRTRKRQFLLPKGRKVPKCMCGINGSALCTPSA